MEGIDWHVRGLSDKARSKARESAQLPRNGCSIKSAGCLALSHLCVSQRRLEVH